MNKPFDPTAGLPEGLAQLLKEQFGNDAQIINMDAVREEFQGIPVEPMNLAQARSLLACSQYVPRAGDLVTLNPHYPFSTAHMKWPVMGEICVVTRVLHATETDYIGDNDESGLCRATSMVLGFSHNCGSDECMQENMLTEYTHDPRMFMRIGTIWDNDAAEPSRPKIPGVPTTGRN